MMFIKIKDKNGIDILLNTDQVNFIASVGEQCYFEFNSSEPRQNYLYATTPSFSEIEELLQKGANDENC